MTSQVVPPSDCIFCNCGAKLSARAAAIFGAQTGHDQGDLQVATCWIVARSAEQARLARPVPPEEEGIGTKPQAARLG